eukprot:scaffold380892_cov57-Attheya_sp.AAC.3
MAHYDGHGICITEGKKDNITGGLYHNLALLWHKEEVQGRSTPIQCRDDVQGVDFYSIIPSGRATACRPPANNGHSSGQQRQYETSGRMLGWYSYMTFAKTSGGHSYWPTHQEIMHQYC